MNIYYAVNLFRKSLLPPPPVYALPRLNSAPWLIPKHAVPAFARTARFPFPLSLDDRLARLFGQVIDFLLQAGFSFLLQLS
jgi:hypothetical protein